MFSWLTIVLSLALAGEALSLEHRLQTSREAIWQARVDPEGCVLSYHHRDHPHDIEERSLDLSVGFAYMLPTEWWIFSESNEPRPTREEFVLVNVTKGKRTPAVTRLSIRVDNETHVPEWSRIHERGASFLFSASDAKKVAAALNLAAAIELQLEFEDQVSATSIVGNTLYETARAMFDACKKHI